LFYLILSAGDKHYINVFEDENRLRKQIRSAVTDTGEKTDGEMSPGLEGLFTLLKAGGNIHAYDTLMEHYNADVLKYVDLKDAVADTLVELSQTFKAKKAEIIADKKNVKLQIKQSSAEIRKVAQETLREVKDLVGLLNVKF